MRLKGRIGTIALGVAVAASAALAVPASSGAAVTIGSNLQRAPDVTFGCAPDCTVVQRTLQPASRAPGGLTAPVNGTVNSLRVRAGSPVSLIRLRVVKRRGSGFVGAGTWTVGTPAPNAISTFATRLPIQIGDRIGIDCCRDAAEFFVGGFGDFDIFRPLTDSGASASPDGGAGNEIAIQATIEPTAAFSIEEVKPLKRGRLRVTAALPNPGTLVVRDERGKRPRLHAQAASLAGPGRANLVLAATKRAKKRLKRIARRKGKKKARIKAGLRVEFTPRFGSPSVQAQETKLRR